MAGLGREQLGMMRLLLLFLCFISFSAQAETPLINCNGTSFLQSRNNPPQWICGTPTGSVSTTGTPANGNLTKFSGATSITNGNLSGDVSTSGSLVTTLATVNSNVGTFQGLTLNAKGLVTAASNQNYLTGNQAITLSGDTTGSGTTAITTTTGKVNGVSYGTSPSTNTVPVVTGTNTTTYETVPNAALTNSSTTVNGQTCTLGSTCTISAGSGTVTNVIDSSGFFSIATSTTTPTFTFANAAANTVFGNNTGGSAAPGFQTSLNISGTAATAAHTITSASASALAVGANGATNPVFSVDDSTASVATGVSVKGAATGGTTVLQATDSGANSSISLSPKGGGSIGFGGIDTTVFSSIIYSSATDITPFVVNASASSISNSVGFMVRLPSTGLQKGFSISNGSDIVSWSLFGYQAGTSSAGSPGFALGPGGSSARDISLYRSGSSTFSIGNAAGGNGNLTTLGTLKQGANQVFSIPGTGLSASGATINSKAAYQMSFQPGLLTSVTSTISVFSKVSSASTVDNIVGSAFLFSCVANPTITMYECGTSATCATPTTIGTVTVTAAGTAVNGTVSSAAVTAGDYVGFAISSGTCTSLDISATAQIHAN